MDGIYNPLADLFILIAFNYLITKLRSFFYVQSNKLWVIPLLTGICVIWLLLLPGRSSDTYPAMYSVPLIAVGMRHGLLISLLSAVSPGIYSYFMLKQDFAFIFVIGLLLPAIFSSLFYKTEYNSLDRHIKYTDGIKVCLLLYLVRDPLFFSLDTDRFFSSHGFVNLVSDWAVTTIAVIVMTAMFNSDTKKTFLQRQLEMQANLDSLTRLPNIRNFILVAENTLKRNCISILMIDIDHFKNYNDRLGHIQGDHLLRITAKVLRDSIGEHDYIARYGGEEFIVMCATDDRRYAEYIAEKLCNRVALYPFKGREVQPEGRITISIGISVARSTDQHLLEIIAEADEALYASKRAGKNRVTFYDDLSYKKIKNT